MYNKEEDDTMKWMKMKKTVALTVLFMFLLSSVCMAFTPDPNRWVWIGSNDEVGVFYDKHTIQYFDDGNICDVWIMTVEPAKGKYTVAHERYKKSRKWTVISFSEHSMKTKKQLDSVNAGDIGYFDIRPESVVESIYLYLFTGSY